VTAAVLLPMCHDTCPKCCMSNAPPLPSAPHTYNTLSPAHPLAVPIAHDLQHGTVTTTVFLTHTLPPAPHPCLLITPPPSPPRVVRLCGVGVRSTPHQSATTMQAASAHPDSCCWVSNTTTPTTTAQTATQQQQQQQQQQQHSLTRIHTNRAPYNSRSKVEVVMLYLVVKRVGGPTILTSAAAAAAVPSTTWSSVPCLSWSVCVQVGA
jgi:hypothetical protein